MLAKAAAAKKDERDDEEAKGALIVGRKVRTRDTRIGQLAAIEEQLDEADE